MVVICIHFTLNAAAILAQPGQLIPAGRPMCFFPILTPFVTVQITSCSAPRLLDKERLGGAMCESGQEKRNESGEKENVVEDDNDEAVQAAFW